MQSLGARLKYTEHAILHMQYYYCNSLGALQCHACIQLNLASQRVKGYTTIKNAYGNWQLSMHTLRVEKKPLYHPTIVESLPVDGGDFVPKVPAPRVNRCTYRIQHAAHNVLFIRKVMLSLAWASLESANDGKQSIFGEIHTNHTFAVAQEDILVKGCTVIKLRAERARKIRPRPLSIENSAHFA